MNDLKISEPVLSHIPQKPVALPVNLEGIPASLKERPQWVLWQWQYDSESERWTKPPRQSNGQYASTSNPDTWATFDAVHRAYLDGDFDGIGIVLRDDLIGIDLDHVVDVSGELTLLAAEIVEHFHDAYMEKSPSGDGLRLFTLGTFPRFGKGTEHKNFECYGNGSPRYLTVTGQKLTDTAEITHQAEALNWLYETHFRKSTTADAKLPTVADSSMTGMLDDAVVLANAAQAGNGERFRKLFERGDFSDYSSQSEADLALANMLARATQDPATLDRLFRLSELIRPEKWDESHSVGGQTYGQMTIAKALTSENAMKQREAPAARSRGFVRAADMMAVTHTVDWLIDGVMEKGTSCILFGASGSGKSFVAIDWACCIATGTDWHGHDVESGAVFYIAGEGQKGFGRRLNAWQQKNDVSLQNAPLYLWPFPIPLSNSDRVKELAAQIEKVASESEPPRMIVIDTLARNIGEADENSNADMGELMNLLDDHLRLPFNTTVVVVHHSGNGDRDRLRGASSLTGAVDYEYRVDRKGGARSLVCKKNKEGEEGEDRHFLIENVPLEGNVSSAAIVMVDMPKTGARVKLRKPSVTSYSVLKSMTDACGVVPNDELKAALAFDAPPLVVPKERWKDESIAAGITTGTTDDAKRKAFDRAFDQLVNEANLVGTYGSYVWAK